MIRTKKELENSVLSREKTYEDSESILERVNRILTTNGQSDSMFEAAEILSHKDGTLSGARIWSKDLIIVIQKFPGSINWFDIVAVWRNPPIK